MKLSTRARYASRAVVQVALNNGEKPVLIRDIALKQGISQRYLEQLIASLVAGGILRTRRGTGGGVSLARPADRIKLSEVISVVEGSLAPVECVNKAEICERSAVCVTRDLWCELKKAMDAVLESKTVQDLVDQSRASTESKDAMYYI